MKTNSEKTKLTRWRNYAKKINFFYLQKARWSYGIYQSLFLTV